MSIMSKNNRYGKCVKRQIYVHCATLTTRYIPLMVLMIRTINVNKANV
jgi:hypothetical protein